MNNKGMQRMALVFFLNFMFLLVVTLWLPITLQWMYKDEMKVCSRAETNLRARHSALDGQFHHRMLALEKRYAEEMLSFDNRLINFWDVIDWLRSDVDALTVRLKESPPTSGRR